MVFFFFLDYNLFMENSIKKWFKDLLKIVLSSIAIAFLVVNLLFITVKVDGKSMYGTLKDKDYGISFIFTRNFLGINRFDIVTLKVENFNNLLVKRVIALPNEIIEYKDNKLYINGTFVEQDFLSKDQLTEDFKYQLAEDEYFVMGDNRVASLDSRSFGPIKKSAIKTSGILILYPLSNFGVKK